MQPSIDLGPTLLEYFGLQRTEDMLGKDLSQTIADDSPVRDYGIFGCHGRHVNVTDGRFVYMRGPVDRDAQPLFEYTLMPCRMRKPFGVDELAGKSCLTEETFRFAKGCPLLKVTTRPSPPGGESFRFEDETQLFDLERDPEQKRPIEDEAEEGRLIEAMKSLMKEGEAPPEQYERLGI